MTSSAGPVIPNARIEWKDNDTPVSGEYNDVYFSKESGQRETEHVFINANQLDQRFKAMSKGDTFIIAETGFGSGLNFLTAWHHFENHAPAGSGLSFVSVEKAPLSLSDLERSQAAWPGLQDKARAFQGQYPEPVQGVHRCSFPGKDQQSIRLTLFYGEAEDWLENCRFIADAWFMDGFSPKLNPEMWTSGLFEQIKDHSKPTTTLATFTAAGFIRRGLAEQGFKITKVPGFGSKRDMTCGFLPASLPTQAVSEAQSIKATPFASGKRSKGRGLVVGAGLAGVMTANSLARRGYEIELIDQKTVATGASGNPQGALYIKLAVDWNPHTRYHLASYLYALRAYSEIYQLNDLNWQATGVLQLAYNDKEAARQEKFLNTSRYPSHIVYPVTKRDAEQLTGVDLKQGGLFFPQGGWCRPVAICQQLARSPGIKLKTAYKVVAQDIINGIVRLRDSENKQVEGDFVIYCTGQSLAINGLCSDQMPVPVKPIRGQISQITIPTVQPFPLKTVICGDGYAMPATITHNDCGPESVAIVTGATFSPNCTNTEITQEDHEENLRKLVNLSQTFKSFTCKALSNPDEIKGRASIRAALPDYLPATGLLKPSTYINCGFGSKGLALAPLAAEVIADMIDDNPLPLEDDLINRLSPQRFLK